MNGLLMDVLLGIVVVCAAIIIYGLIMGHESVYWKDKDD